MVCTIRLLPDHIEQTLLARLYHIYLVCSDGKGATTDRLINHSSMCAQAREEAAKDTSQALVIDVTKYGMSKVLGKGQLPAQPVVVSHPSCSILVTRHDACTEMGCSVFSFRPVTLEPLLVWMQITFRQF